MNYVELADKARDSIGDKCKACRVCDGRACRNTIPGPGAKGTGTVATRNYDAWQQVLVNMDTLHSPSKIDLTRPVLGHDLSLPVLIAPVGDVNRHYGPAFDTMGYDRCAISAARRAGTIAFTGDGPGDELMRGTCALIAENDGCGIPTIKPWGADVVMRKVAMANAARPVAIAMDVDGAGLPFLRGLEPPAGPKSVSELADFVTASDAPFIAKGIMTVTGAKKAVEAGAAAIVVSNHGGRVLDGVPATADVLPQIAKAVGDDVCVLVDGGIRSGLDVFRALALGADAALVCRPFVVAAYGGGEQGIYDLLCQYATELEDVMLMCGADSLDDITEDMIR